MSTSPKEAVAGETVIESVAPKKRRFQEAFQRYVLDSIRPGTPISSVMATLADYLQATKIIESCRYSIRNNQVICKFCTRNAEEKCAQPCEQEISIELMCELVRTALVRGGYAVKNIHVQPINGSTNLTVNFRPA